ncbi:MAG: hypothetical protein OXC26_09520, partial [Albidovulum sp.]|nr:hypothetical protein [Albidovulum sp.]
LPPRTARLLLAGAIVTRRDSHPLEESAFTRRTSFWDYLRNRLGVAGAPGVPRLADLIRQRAATPQPDI